jgi:hypothetical protein
VAEAQRQALLKNGQDQKVHGPRLDDCIERFSASRKEELGEKTDAAGCVAKMIVSANRTDRESLRIDYSAFQSNHLTWPFRIMCSAVSTPHVVF